MLNGVRRHHFGPNWEKVSHFMVKEGLAVLGHKKSTKSGIEVSDIELKLSLSPSSLTRLLLEGVLEKRMLESELMRVGSHLFLRQERKILIVVIPDTEKRSTKMSGRCSPIIFQDLRTLIQDKPENKEIFTAKHFPLENSGSVALRADSTHGLPDFAKLPCGELHCQGNVIPNRKQVFQ
ncbi:hypothetical protein Tco_1186097 [Tanacetum coccineum]